MTAFDTVSDDEADETWRPIPGFEGYYEASSLGRVRSVERTRKARLPNGSVYLRKVPSCVLRQASRGYRGLYRYVNLNVNGKQTSMSVHLAVLLAHHGPPPFEGAEVLHGPNHDPSDNRACNLRWGTHEENNYDRNRNNGFAAEQEIDAQARREGWDGRYRVELYSSDVPF